MIYKQKMCTADADYYNRGIKQIYINKIILIIIINKNYINNYINNF